MMGQTVNVLMMWLIVMKDLKTMEVDQTVYLHVLRVHLMMDQEIIV